jgi:hypothetical protein
MLRTGDGDEKVNLDIFPFLCAKNEQTVRGSANLHVVMLIYLIFLCVFFLQGCWLNNKLNNLALQLIPVIRSLLKSKYQER